MKNNQIQKIAEQVLDVEARIVNWDGSITDWARDLIRLRKIIQELLDTACKMRDTNQEEFLRCLLNKTNLCRENVLHRARWMSARHEPDIVRDLSYTNSGYTAEVTENSCT